MRLLGLDSSVHAGLFPGVASNAPPTGERRNVLSVAHTYPQVQLTINQSLALLYTCFA
jgi:hypothetical protein